MLKVKELCSGYDKMQIVNNITMEVNQGQIVSIVGANGVGKSTLLKTICGILKPMHGEIEFFNERIDRLPSHKIVEKGLVMVPEGRQLFNYLTVEENLKVGSSVKKCMEKRAETMEQVFEMFPRLKERKNQMAGILSGGEQQMVAMGRALMAHPRLLIMDEPSWGLAPILVQELFATIEKVREKGMAILLVEQNVSQALSMCDMGYVIEQGDIVMSGVGKELLKDPQLKKAYLGI